MPRAVRFASHWRSCRCCDCRRGNPPPASVDAHHLFDAMPPRKRGKIVHGDGEAAPAVVSDRIGALPDALLHHVLSFLPARSAVRTCVLARRWRHLWKFAPRLRVGYYDQEKPRPMKKLLKFVEHLLLLRGRRAPLEAFELRFGGSYDAEDTSRLNLLVRHVVICQVRMLRINETARNSFMLDNLPLVSQHLMRLELVGVGLRDSFVNFSSCPSLEHLEMSHCHLWAANKISSLSLKRLSITNCYFSLVTHIYAPNTISLWLDGHLGVPHCLESMPSLQEAFVRDAEGTDCYDDDECYSCSGTVGGDIDDNKCLLLEGLSKANDLALLSESSSFIFERDLKQCPTFSKLKTLLINDSWCVAPDFHALTCILKHSPILEKLTLQLFSKGDKHKVEMIGRYYPMERAATAIMSEHLKTIEVKCEMVNEEVYNVLKFLCTFNIYFLFK